MPLHFFASIAVCVALILVLSPFASKVNLIALPGAHRQHQKPTPLVGGIALVLSGFIVCTVFNIYLPYSLLWSSALLFIFGMVDDRWTLPYWVRFAAQIGAAVILVSDGILLSDLGALTSESLFLLGRWDKALTIFALVGVINAVNMIDGMDGLLGLLGCVVIVAILSQLPLEMMSSDRDIALVVWGGLCGFLLFNLRLTESKPARVFMGDAGSMFLGLIFGWLLIRNSQPESAVFPPVIAIWILAIPLFDTVGVMIRRIIRGQSPFQADRLHTHHLLQAKGFSVNMSLSIIIFTSIVVCSIGIVAFHSGVAEHHLFFAFLVFFAFYVVCMEIAQRGVEE